MRLVHESREPAALLSRQVRTWQLPALLRFPESSMGENTYVCCNSSEHANLPHTRPWIPSLRLWITMGEIGGPDPQNSGGTADITQLALFSGSVCSRQARSPPTAHVGSFELVQPWYPYEAFLETEAFCVNRSSFQAFKPEIRGIKHL